MTPASTPVSRRRNRLAVAAVAVTAAAALVLGACSSGDDASSTTTAPSGSTTVVKTSSLADVQFSTDTATAPTATFAPSFALTEPASEVVVEGTGATLVEGQRVSLDYVVVSGVDGSQLESTWGQKPDTLPLDANLQPVIKDALIGQKVGARVAVATENGGQWIILIFDLRAVVEVLDIATGETVVPPPGLPTVVFTDGKPTITLPGTPAPTTLIVQPLVKGTGAVVEAGQTVTVQYTGIKWPDGAVFDSSWERGTPVDFPVGNGGVIAGFEEGLIGQTVGSRVLLVIPPDKGYGPQGNAQAGISGTDTLVFVVDILAAS